MLKGSFSVEWWFPIKMTQTAQIKCSFCLLNFKNSTERLILLMFSEEIRIVFLQMVLFLSFHRLTLVHQFWIDWLHLNRSLYSLRFENRMECHDFVHHDGRIMEQWIDFSTSRRINDSLPRIAWKMCCDK